MREIEQKRLVQLRGRTWMLVEAHTLEVVQIGSPNEQRTRVLFPRSAELIGVDVRAQQSRETVENVRRSLNANVHEPGAVGCVEGVEAGDVIFLVLDQERVNAMQHLARALAEVVHCLVLRTADLERVPSWVVEGPLDLLIFLLRSETQQIVLSLLISTRPLLSIATYPLNLHLLSTNLLLDHGVFRTHGPVFTPKQPRATRDRQAQQDQIPTHLVTPVLAHPISLNHRPIILDQLSQGLQSPACLCLEHLDGKVNLFMAWDMPVDIQLSGIRNFAPTVRRQSAMSHLLLLEQPVIHCVRHRQVQQQMMDEIADMHKRDTATVILHEVRQIEQLFLEIQDVPTYVYHTHAQQTDIPDQRAVAGEDFTARCPC
ncbi:hypothetical protein KC361_g134 [Hortaea werneckii]|nr:hypothetical protein KC361_g134 [Hortaea werneckii]